MSDDKKSFTVSDRRHFTAEGEARGPSESAQEEGSPAIPSTGSRDASAEPEPPGDFTSLLVSLAAQASLLLGGGGEGAEGGSADLGGARHIISILEMLKEKTEGRRTPREEQVLEGILYELRMTYVARAR